MPERIDPKTAVLDNGKTKKGAVKPVANTSGFADSNYGKKGINKTIKTTEEIDAECDGVTSEQKTGIGLVAIVGPIIACLALAGAAYVFSGEQNTNSSNSARVEPNSYPNQQYVK